MVRFAPRVRKRLILGLEIGKEISGGGRGVQNTGKYQNIYLIKSKNVSMSMLNNLYLRNFRLTFYMN